MLACGHSVEASLTTDVTLAVGAEQLTCLADVMASNSPRRPAGREGGGKSEPPQLSDNHVPVKALLTGQTVTVVLLKETNSVAVEDVHDSRFGSGVFGVLGEATPLLQASLFNPLLSAQTGGGADSCWEVACFNIAISSMEEPIPISEHQCTLSWMLAEPRYSPPPPPPPAFQDLLDPPSLLALLPSPLLETRRGQTREKSGLPPNFLTFRSTHNSLEESSGMA